MTETVVVSKVARVAVMKVAGIKVKIAKELAANAAIQVVRVGRPAAAPVVK